MRPLELVIKGFRSYTGRTVIDWRGRRLVGVVGPIGSGKTSILDAVAFALYGKTPVFATESKTLIRQGSESARVELTFEAGGDTWRVIRLIRHVGVGRHVLYRGESSIPEFEKEREVTGRIEELLGLDFPTFCRSVLLAQNRFAEFLNASPGDRDKVLKGVFGFDRLDDMHQLARQRRGVAELVLKELDGRLATLDEDRGRLEQARQAAEGSSARVQRFEDVAEKVRELSTQEVEAQRQAGEVRRRGAELRELAGQLPSEAELEERLGTAEQAGAELARREEALRLAAAVLTEVEQHRQETVAEVGSAEDHARAESRLAALRQAEQQAGRKRQRLAQLERACGDHEVELEKFRLALKDAARLEKQAGEEAERSSAALRRVREEQSAIEDEVGDREALARARDEVQRLRLSHADVERTLDALGKIEERLEVTEGDLTRAAAERDRALAGEEAAEARRQEASKAMAQAEEGVREAEHAEMAQTLAKTLRSGKPCPVCDQPVRSVQARLPSANALKAGAELDAARSADQAAAEELLELSKKAAAWRQTAENVEATRGSTREERVDADRQLKAQRTVCEEIEAGLTKLLGEGDPQARLVAAEQRLITVEGDLRRREEAERTASEALREAHHRHELTCQQENAGRIALDSARLQLAETEAEIREAESALGEARKEVEALLGEGEPDALLKRARQRLTEAESQLASARTAWADASRGVDTAREQVDEARASQEHLANRLAGLAGQLGHVGDAEAETLTPRQLSALIRDRLRDSQATASADQEKALAGEKQAREERRRIHQELGLDTGQETLADFEAALADARAAHARDGAVVVDLEARLAKAEELAEERRVAAEEHKLYVQLADDLTASKFLRYLLEQERAALADLGSERFEMLSEGRYRFTHDGAFHVIDQHNANAVRKADTLSGGETFLAALALALALAEKVTASGGRLDAFFLDEGFGSLDAEHLTLAMEGIERLVTDSPNRLVTVVSHVPEMRERIEDLIELDKDPMTGSTIVKSGARRSL